MQDTALQKASDRRVEAVRAVVAALADQLDIDASVRLWDGSRLPLGNNVTGPLEIVIASPSVIGGLLRWPTLDNIIQNYIDRRIDITGGDLLVLGRMLNKRPSRRRLRAGELARLGARLAPFLLEHSRPASELPAAAYGFMGQLFSAKRNATDNKSYIQYHYDLSNDFYALFLDPQMVYSCGYFTRWDNDLATAQTDKLEMICRKLRLKPGERFLDIGSGWGALVCHAARHHGVIGLGITLSERQLEFARRRAAAMGLQSQVRFELIDYQQASGTFDKIASIGMYEHIGLPNIPTYMRKVRGLLAEDGLFLNHAISRRAPKSGWQRRRKLPEQRALAKYIFPGGELDDIGNTLAEMERAGFEVQDVEAWRMHYARTCEIWHERLMANRATAVALVGEGHTRIFLAYLAGVTLAFESGSARIFQALVSRTAKRPPALPPTRADLYR